MVWTENKEKDVTSKTMYETEKNRQDELNIITRMMKVFNWKYYMKFPKQDIIDYSIMNDNSRITHVVETKYRDYLINDFDAWHLKKHKLIDGFKKSKTFKCKFIYAIKTKDNSIYYAELTEDMHFDEFVCKITEPDGIITKITHVKIPTNLFKRLIENN